MGVNPGVLCDGTRGDAGDKGIHPDIAGHHSDASGLPANL